MKRRKIIGHVTPVGGNVFRDLGFPAYQARKMLNKSNREIEKRLQAQALRGDKSSQTTEDSPPDSPSPS